MDTVDKFSILCIGVATVAVVAMCYKVYSEPSSDEIVKKYFEDAGLEGPLDGVNGQPTVSKPDDEPMPKPPSPPITPGEAKQN